MDAGSQSWISPDAGLWERASRPTRARHARIRPDASARLSVAGAPAADELQNSWRPRAAADATRLVFVPCGRAGRRGVDDRNRPKRQRVCGLRSAAQRTRMDQLSGARASDGECPAPGSEVARRLFNGSWRSRLVRLNRRRVIGVERQACSPFPLRVVRRTRPCGRIAVCESSAIARTSSRSRRAGRSSPPWSPGRGSPWTRCALPPTLRQPPLSCSGEFWMTSIGPERGSPSRHRMATGADS
jgi:hypothetical protein